MVIYCIKIFTGALEYKKETFWMLPVSIIKKKYFRGCLVPRLFLICGHLCAPPHKGEFTAYGGLVNCGHLIRFYRF